MEQGATTEHTICGTRISSTDFLEDTVVVQIGAGVWLQLVGTPDASDEGLVEWTRRCAHYLDEHLDTMPGEPWVGPGGERLALVRSTLAPRGVVVVDDAGDVEEIRRWAQKVTRATRESEPGSAAAT